MTLSSYHAGAREPTRNNVAYIYIYIYTRRNCVARICRPAPLSSINLGTPNAIRRLLTMHLRSICSPSIVHMKNKTKKHNPSSHDAVKKNGLSPLQNAFSAETEASYNGLGLRPRCRRAKAKGRLLFSALSSGGWACRTLGGQD